MKETKKNNPLISMIIPVYNTEKYIEKCFDSLLNQTCLNNVEIIVIDDGSDDKSGLICDGYSKDNEQIKVFHTVNKGLSSARNTGLELATGKWIGFLDSDDWVEENYFSIINDAIQTYSSDIISFGYFEEFYNKSIEKAIVDNVEINIQASDYVQKKNYNNAVWNKIYKSCLFSDILFLVGHNYEDIDISFEILEKSHGITCIPDNLIHYRRRCGSIVTKYKINDLIDCWNANYNRFLKFGNDNEGFLIECTKGCIVSGISIWCWIGKYEKQNPTAYNDQLESINKWVKENAGRVVTGSYSPIYKVMLLILQYKNDYLFRALYIFNKIYRLMRRKKLYG